MKRRVFVEHRRNPRVPRVSPILLDVEDISDARGTLSANVSRGGMLLACRSGTLPEIGRQVAVAAPHAELALGRPIWISARVVRHSASNDTHVMFAGLRFEEELSEESATELGLLGGSPAGGPARPDSAGSQAIPQQGRLPGPAPSVESLDSAVRRFLIECNAFLKTWMRERMLESVLRDPAEQLRLTPDELALLKSELHALEEDLPNRIEARLDGRDLWPHRRTTGLRQRSALEYFDAQVDRPGHLVVESVRRIMGDLGRILCRHGLESAGPRSEWVCVRDDTYEYNRPVPFSADALCALEEAADLYCAMVNAARRRREQDVVRERETLRALWEEL